MRQPTELEEAAAKKDEEGFAFQERGEWDKALAAHIEACRMEPDGGDFLEHMACAWVRASDDPRRPGYVSLEIWEQVTELGATIMRVIGSEAATEEATCRK